MQKLRLILIGLGFFWIFAWSVFGSILGAYLNLMASTQVASSASMSWQNGLLRSAHAHMNVMGVTTILLGITLIYARSFFSTKIIKLILWTNVCSVPIFGLGTVLEAFFPPKAGMVAWATGVTALGGVVYMLTIAVWASLFIFAAMKKND